MIMSNVSQEYTGGTLKVGAIQNGCEGTQIDNSLLQITTVKLDGTNYLTWSRFAILSIQSRGSFRSLFDRKFKNAEETDPLYDK